MLAQHRFEWSMSLHIYNDIKIAEYSYVLLYGKNIPDLSKKIQLTKNTSNIRKTIKNNMFAGSIPKILKIPPRTLKLTTKGPQDTGLKPV